MSKLVGMKPRVWAWPKARALEDSLKLLLGHLWSPRTGNSAWQVPAPMGGTGDGMAESVKCVPSGHQTQCPPARQYDQMAIWRQFLWAPKAAMLDEWGKNGHQWEAILEARVSRKEIVDKVERWTGEDVNAPGLPRRWVVRT